MNARLGLNQVRRARQADLDRLVKAAVKAGIERFSVVLRDVDGRVEPVLIVDMSSPAPQPAASDAAEEWLKANGAD